MTTRFVGDGWLAETGARTEHVGSGAVIEASLTGGAIADVIPSFDDAVTGIATQAAGISAVDKALPTGYGWVVEFRQLSHGSGLDGWYVSRGIFTALGTITDVPANFVDAVTAVQTITKSIEIFEGRSGDIAAFDDRITGAATQSQEKVYPFIGG